tara:strand:+ start:440 stop:721 length:282 start_codon:yes stop_codon:yes gene_type:complete
MQQELVFDGSDYVHEQDGKRLAKNHFKLKDLMKDKLYRTLGEISHITNIPEASVSAGLRDFRKERFGSHILNKKYLENGLYSYQLILNNEQNG